MQATITIEGKTVGRSRPLFPDWQMPLTDEEAGGGARMTLRSLLARIVTQEVEAFRERQEQRRMLTALTQSDIAEGLMKGKVVSGGQDLQQEVHIDEAVANALQAFEDGVYYVFVDEEQQTELDREVYLRPESRVLFLRLVALAGG